MVPLNGKQTWIFEHDLSKCLESFIYLFNKNAVYCRFVMISCSILLDVFETNMMPYLDVNYFSHLSIVPSLDNIGNNF